MKKRHLLASLGGAALALTTLASLPARAADFPAKPVRIIVPFGPGGVIDGSARLIAEQLGKRWGQQVIVENKPGASGLIGSEFVAKSAPDGYTLLQAGPAIPLHHLITKNLSWHPLKDLAPITTTAITYSSLIVSANVPANNLKEFIAYTRANPGKLTYASLGPTSYTKLNVELFKKLTGTFMPEIPYNASSAMILDLMRNDVQVIFNSISAVKQHVEAGKIKALAIQAPRRSPLYPSMPTMAEAGLKGYETGAALGFMAPAGTPPEIIEKISKDVQAVMAMPEIKKQYQEAWDADATSMTPQQYRKYLDSEAAKWAEVVKFAGVKPE